MSDRIKLLDNLIADKQKVAHLVGVGGCSMSSLAETMLAMGCKVKGSDIKKSEATDRLEEKGLTVVIGHLPENIDGVDYVIRTAAVHDDNPEIARALSLGVPVFERAEAWGSIMKSHENAICISGVHGKTTTSSMVTHIALAGDYDPAVMIGGTLPALNGGHRIGKGPIILESCEYCNSFLQFFPTVAVILNVDADHLDFFRDLDDISASFRKFALRVPEDTGVVVANADDENTMKCIEGIDRKIITFGIKNDADVTAKKIGKSHGMPEFDIYYKGEKFAHVRLLVPGEHNILNSLAAAAASIAAGFDSDSVERGLGSYTGVGRRFEYKGQINGAMIYDDYAHHPNEIKALLDTVESLEFDRVICAFQPHTFTRTAAFFDDFVRELSRPDMLILADVFAARETNTVGVDSSTLASKIEGAYLIPDFDDMCSFISQIARPGDVILTVGAGELNKVSDKLSKTFVKSNTNRTTFGYDVMAGGLRNIDEVKILICYLLNSVGAPIRESLIFQILQADGMAGFFYIMQAISELVSQGAVTASEDNAEEPSLSLTQSGVSIANELETTLPLSVREKVSAAAVKIISRSRAAAENFAVVIRNADGTHSVCIRILEGDIELLSTTIPVKDALGAQLMKEKFLSNPTDFYKRVMSFFE